MTGSMLLAFPELMQDYEVFKMEPRTIGGYGKRYDKRKVTGYWSWRRSGKTEIEGGLQVPEHQATFWVQDDFMSGKPLIARGDFVEVNMEIFRVVQNDDFSREGGFSKCLMQALAGTTDQQKTNKKVDEAILNDY